jgi:hypothetical protein
MLYAYRPIKRKALACQIPRHLNESWAIYFSQNRQTAASMAKLPLQLIEAVHILSLG